MNNLKIYTLIYIHQNVFHSYFHFTKVYRETKSYLQSLRYILHVYFGITILWKRITKEILICNRRNKVGLNHWIFNFNLFGGIKTTFLSLMIFLNNLAKIIDFFGVKKSKKFWLFNEKIFYVFAIMN